VNGPVLRVAFAGTPEFAATILSALLAAPRFAITSVYTRPDRPAGRGRKLAAGPVKLLAARHALPVLQPDRAADISVDCDRGTDVLVTAAYGLKLPPAVLSAPRYGCINVHASLLPRWRGAAPIQRAIQAGDQVTGITIMQMDGRLDTGDILLQRTCPIRVDETGGTLHDRLAALGAECILETLDALVEHRLQPRPQGETGVTYAPRITREDAQIDWRRPAREIERTIRALNPAPIAQTTLNGVEMRIWSAAVIAMPAHGAAPGRIIAVSGEGLDVATGDGAVRISRLQLPGRKPISAADFLNANPDWRETDGKQGP
jgi:methionyl-tRNA formyltransferase